jgi:hypothetical protein
MVTYKGFLAPVSCDYLSREASRRLYAADTEFQFGRIRIAAAFMMPTLKQQSAGIRM